MYDTDYFTIEINGEEIGVSEGRTQYAKIYRFQHGDYRIEYDGKSARAYISENDFVDYKSLAEAWRQIRDNIKADIKLNNI